MTAEHIVFNTGRTTNPFYEESEPMTNYEKIKNMSIDEMARFLCQREQTQDDCWDCPLRLHPIICQGAVLVRKQWLKDEAKK